MTAPKLVPTDTTTAAAAGFPVTVALPAEYTDGPITLSHPTWGSTMSFDVKGGQTTATNGDRLDALVGLGGTPLIPAS
jgi:hypothetical protein